MADKPYPESKDYYRQLAFQIIMKGLESNPNTREMINESLRKNGRWVWL